MPRPAVEVVRLANRQRAELLRHERETTLYLAQRYRGIWVRVKAHLDELAEEERELRAEGREPTPAMIRRMNNYKRLLQEIESRVAEFVQDDLLPEVSDGSREMVRRGLEHAEAKVVEQYEGHERTVIEAQWNRLHPRAVENMLAFIRPESRLHRRIRRRLGEHVARQVGEVLVDGMAKGQNPRTVARRVRQEVGMGLTHALNTARTAHLYAYREADHQAYRENSHVVRAWRHVAKLDRRTCLACISLHGREFPLRASLRDHHRGRCTAIPVVIGREPPELADSEAWFAELPEEVQRKMLGPTRFEMYQAGELDLKQLHTGRADYVYGRMIAVKPVSALREREP